MRAGLEGITRREQQQNCNPNCSLLASLITADLHFYEWLSAGIKVGCRQGKRGGRGCQPSPCPGLAGWVLVVGCGLVCQPVPEVISKHQHLINPPRTQVSGVTLAMCKHSANALGLCLSNPEWKSCGKSGDRSPHREASAVQDQAEPCPEPRSPFSQGGTAHSACSRSHPSVLCGFAKHFPFFFLFWTLWLMCSSKKVSACGVKW